MKYCTHCGKEMLDEAIMCVSCGCAVETPKVSVSAKDDNTLAVIAKVFMIISCVCLGFLIIPLAWCIPMTVSYSRKLENHEPISTGFKVCTLIFVNVVAGILMLVMDDIDV